MAATVFESGYNTGTGYDLATGLGSVDATQLIAGYAAQGSGSGGGTNTPTVTVTPASSSIDVTQTLSVTVAVAGVRGLPLPPEP